eukprot:2488536-Pleurochrysis_carterae.AAC.1
MPVPPSSHTLSFLRACRLPHRRAKQPSATACAHLSRSRTTFRFVTEFLNRSSLSRARRNTTTSDSLHVRDGNLGRLRRGEPSSGRGVKMCVRASDFGCPCVSCSHALRRACVMPRYILYPLRFACLRWRQLPLHFLAPR